MKDPQQVSAGYNLNHVTGSSLGGAPASLSPASSPFPQIPHPHKLSIPSSSPSSAALPTSDVLEAELNVCVSILANVLSFPPAASVLDSL